MRRNLLNEGEMCMTWEASDGRKKKRNVIHLQGEGKCDEGRKKEKRKRKKLCKKWQELMLMALYKYYFQHMEAA